MDPRGTWSRNAQRGDMAAALEFLSRKAVSDKGSKDVRGPRTPIQQVCRDASQPLGEPYCDYVGKITCWLCVGPSGSGADPELKRFVNFRKNICNLLSRAGF